MTYAQKFSRAFLVDYFLMKRPTIANAGSGYAVTPAIPSPLARGVSGSRLHHVNSNATYYNNGNNLSYQWNLNGHLINTANPTISQSDLVSYLGRRRLAGR